MNNFRELEYICAVAEHKSITKAADALFITQSAMSHYISKVEKNLGMLIFDRSTTPISLTYAGECYLESAKKILLEANFLKKQFRDISNQTIGKMRIGTSKERAAYMIPDLVLQFSKLYPGIEIEVHTASGSKLKKALKDGAFDFLILPGLADEELIGIVSESVFQEEILIASCPSLISETHLTNANSNAIDLSKFNDFPFFMLYKDHIIRNTADTIFKQNTVQPKVKMEFTSNITCLRMASTGLGAAIIPKMTTKLTVPDDKLKFFSIGASGFFWDIRVYYRKGAYMGQPERDFFRLIHDNFK